MQHASVQSFELLRDDRSAIFFDIDILDAISHAKMIGEKITDDIDKIGKDHRDNKKVFILAQRR